MDEVRDIGEITIPLAAGVLAASLTGHPFLLSAVSLPCAAVFLVWCAARPGRCTPAVCLLFFSIGLLRFSAASLTGGLAGASDILSRVAGGCLDRLLEQIDNIPFPDQRSGALLKALLTGHRETLDPAVTQAFRASGASHILALSGLHLGVIYMVVSRVSGLLGRSTSVSTARALLTMGLCGFYTLMTGASPSIVRAFIYICFNEMLRLHPERRRSPAAILCSALTIQLILDPGVISSLGFQLSYLAMCGISTVFPVLDSWYPGRRSLTKSIWSSASLSLSCQLFTAPLVWLRFRTFPRYFLLTNLLALPLTEAAMISALATIVLNAAGACPQELVIFTDKLCVWLISCLELISTM